jgi:hypothetical protein
MSRTRNQRGSRWQGERHVPLKRRLALNGLTLHNHRCENLKSYVVMLDKNNITYCRTEKKLQCIYKNDILDILGKVKLSI